MSQPLPDDLVCIVCGGDRIQLVETGYTRTFAVERVDTDGEPAFVLVSEDYPSSYSDEGDGDSWFECRTCLARYTTSLDIEYGG